ncbi:MAG: type II and III secretion system protein [Bryobacteraceae bacterium]
MRTVSTALILLSLAVSTATAQQPSPLLQAARRAEAAGDTLNAFFLYGQAAAAEPGNAFLAMQGRALGERLAQTAATSNGLDPARDPETRMANRIATEEISPTDAIESAMALAPPRLQPSTDRKPFDLRGTARLIIEAVTSAYGIRTSFEPDFQSSATVTFRTGELSRDEAFRALEATTNTFFVPIRDNTVLVFPDTTDKRNTNAPVMAVAIPIPQRMSVQEAQELASGVQQIMELRHIAVDAGRHVIFMRDQEYKVIAARRLISDMSRYRTQVAVEVELLSVAKSSSLDIGLSLQNVASIINFSSPSTLANLAHIGTSWFGLGLANAGAFATLSRSSTQSSLLSRMTTLDGQQAQLHIGDRYPVITGLSGFGDTSVPIVQFQDLGLNLQITPSVHADGEITLTIEADYNVLGGSSNNGIPIISQRKFTGTVRSRADEWTVIAGLAVTQTSNTSNGIAGLSDIPAVGRIFRKDTKIDDSSQILIILKPRILSEPAWEHPTEAFWMGTETKPPTFY